MDRETGAFFRVLSGLLERILASLDGLAAGELNWRPPLAEANSLFAIATHALANAERNVLGTYRGEPYDWQREAEFAATGESAEALTAQWSALRPRLESALTAAGAEGLTRVCQHPRMGLVPGREVLLRATWHAAEHAGEAELTRKWLDAGRVQDS